MTAIWTSQVSYEIPDGPARFMKRARKFRAPRRCESLPEWELVPAARPLYVCQQCGFANRHGELCLFCIGSCVVTVHNSAPARRRRVSAPQLLNDIQKERLHFIYKRVAILRVPGIVINQGDSQEVLLRSLSDSGPSLHVPKSSEPLESRKRRHRDAAIFTVNKMEAKYLCPRDERVTELIAPQSSAVSSVPIASTASSSQSVSSDGKDAEHGRPGRSPTPGSEKCHRTLRRCKRLSLKKTASLCSIRAIFVHIPTKSDPTKVDISASVPDIRTIAESQSNNMNMSQDGALRNKFSTLPPLGHPSRPLYTAIRKNMFPSPSSSATASNGRSPPLRAVIDDTSSMNAFGHISRLSGDSVSTPSFQPYAERQGFSMSGQTEVRMALARLNNLDGTCGAGEFRFQETKRRAKTLSGRVRRLGQCLKGLLHLV